MLQTRLIFFSFCASRAQIRLTIEDTLDDGLPRAYTPDLYQRKVNDLFEHIYESYTGEGKSIYSQTG